VSFSLPKGSWVTSGKYYHHMAVNLWADSVVKKVDNHKCIFINILENEDKNEI